ncbi:hypothetical protein ACIQMP_21445 [Streptomyces sp. NPDC091385]|uniref:hypothetical protein n=1 Tax=Streptomyces sp. NPDC091385 TaxID=3365997 RepID=UPI00381F8D06
MRTVDEKISGKRNEQQMEFPPLPNALDYLESATRHLTGPKVTPRDVKYAVLHLHAGTEVLLKATLAKENWRLVFDDPARATRERYESGDFRSCTVVDALVRLRDNSKIAITDDDIKTVRALTRDRNALQHFGLTHSAAAVEARAATVVDFLLAAILSEDAFAVDGREEESSPLFHIRRGLSNISLFVKQRMDRIAPQLAAAKDKLLYCTSCGNRAAVDEPEKQRARCLYCDYLMDGDGYELEVEYRAFLKVGDAE